MSLFPVLTPLHSRSIESPALFVDELIRKNRRFVYKLGIYDIIDCVQVFLGKIKSGYRRNSYFRLTYYSKNVTGDVNCTFNYRALFSANITSAIHHSFHFKFSTTTANGGLTHSSSLAATFCFVTRLKERCISSQTRMTVAHANVNLVFISSILETAIRQSNKMVGWRRIAGVYNRI